MTPPPSEDPLRPTPSGEAQELAQRLEGPASDRAASSRVAAREVAREIHAWVLPRSAAWSLREAAAELEHGLRNWIEGQAWRGVGARLVADLRAALRHSQEPRASLLAALRPWLASAPSDSCGVELERLAIHAEAELGQEDVVLVHGYSTACIQALEAAQRAGKAPRAVLSECAPDSGGKRAARELNAHGIATRLIWDLAVPAWVERVDHIWLGSEAVGAGAFLAPLGSEPLLERARACEVPTRALAAASDFVPGGELRLPNWTERWSDELWLEPPEGVQLDAAPLEFVDADRVDGWITEAGIEHFAQFCLRALPPEVGALC